MYLLDTNVCISVINGMPRTIVKRFESTIASGAEIYISSVSSFELWYGVAKSTRQEFNRRQLETFLAGALGLLPFDDEAFWKAGEVRAYLEREGKPIGPYDLLIAGQALARNLVVVTANVREFSRVPGLVCEDWSA